MLENLLQKYVSYVLISVTTIVYLKLCYSNPGVAPEILRKYQLKHGIVDDAISELAAGTNHQNTEEIVLPKYVICNDCSENAGEFTGSLIVTKRLVKHCVFCGVCIVEIDHHCSYFDRCIGGSNLLLFYAQLVLFVITMSLILIFYFQ